MFPVEDIRAGFLGTGHVFTGMCLFPPDDLYRVSQSLYYNLPVVGPAISNFLVSFQLPCSGGKCSAALCQIFVYEDFVLVSGVA